MVKNPVIWVKMPAMKTHLQGQKILITGGLGFIGFNTARYFAARNQVCVIDDASRPGVENNISPLQKFNVAFHKADISRLTDLSKIYYDFNPDIVIHLAAQVAVTSSITNPGQDFASNVLGSFNLLELARVSRKKPVMLYASTNKVYGNKSKVQIKDNRYVQVESPEGLNEEALLSFETPYGCSKGAADQYFLDYYRTFQIPTVVFRQSCIYGTNQYRFEDQGWVAWFSICAALGKPVTIFGDGNQVRDCLYIDDLTDVYEKSILNIRGAAGEVFNIGGGPEYSLTPNECLQILQDKLGKKLAIYYADWRLNDQKVYISDVRKAERLLGWEPIVGPEEGLDRLLEWINEEKESITAVHQEKESVISR